MKKKIPILLAVFALAIALLALHKGTAAQAGAAMGEKGSFTLYIMHTNDVHAHFEQINKYGGTCSQDAAAAGKCFGGVARRATEIKKIRAEHPDALLLDAGDEFQGTLFFNQYQGKAAQKFMNMLGYNAMVVGNHEFDSGPKVLAEFIKGAKFPVLGANVDASQDPYLKGLLKPYVILNVNGHKVGIIGVTTEMTSILSSPGDKVKFSDPIETAQKYAKELESKGVNIIILLSHLGYNRDQELAKKVAGIDIIVGGHSHTFLANNNKKAAGPYPTVVESPRKEPVLIVTAKAYGQYLGYLQATFNQDGVATAWEGEPILLDKNIPEDPQVLAVVKELAKPLEKLRHTVIGKAAVDLDGERSHCRFAECTMGDLVTDAILWKMKDQGIQIALQNGGGIRASIPAGDVTVGQVLEVLPFGNTVATFEIKGSDLLAALENGVSKADNPENEGTGRFLQVAGLRYSWDPSQPVGHRIVSAEVRNADGTYSPIDPNATYKVAANNYIRHGGDGYSMFKEHAINPYDYGPLLADVVIDYIKAHSPVSVKLEGRIKKVKAQPTATPTAVPTATPTTAPTATPKPKPTATLAPSPTPSPAPKATSSSWIWPVALLALVIVLGAIWAIARGKNE